MKRFSTFATAFLLILCIFLGSCSKKVAFVKSAVVPAAQGRVKIDNDDNNNYSVDVFVENLAPASRLNPPKKVYVVWIETEHNGTINLGQLKSSSGWFSNALEASLKTVTPYRSALLSRQRTRPTLGHLASRQSS